MCRTYNSKKNTNLFVLFIYKKNKDKYSNKNSKVRIVGSKEDSYKPPKNAWGLRGYLIPVYTLPSLNLTSMSYKSAAKKLEATQCGKSCQENHSMTCG
jgi:hypothetical protein